MVEPIDIRTGKPFASRRQHMHHPPSDGASLGGAMGRTRGLLGGCFTGCMMSQQSKPWSNPYITDGLMSMVDAEWNGGGGLHLDSPTMVNLGYGDGVVSISNDAVMSSNYLSINRGTGISIYDSDFTSFVTRNGFTLEIVGRYDQYYAGVYLSQPGFYSNDNYNFRWGYSGWDVSSISPTTGDLFRFWHRCCKRGVTNPSPCAYCNGATLNRNMDAAAFSISTTIRFGKSMKGRIYSVRLYDRLLTNDELMANSVVDHERFGTILQTS